GGDPDGDAGPDGVVDELERLAQSGALVRWERDVVRRPVVRQRRLAGPHVAADLDDLPGPGERAVVGHAVEALDHLGPRRAQAELAAATRNGIDAGGGHR